MNWISIFVVAGVTVGISNALAAPSGKRGTHIDHRQQLQQARINAGMKNGSITPAEQARLKHQQERVMKTEKRAKADGQINRREARRIEKQQNRANRNIYRHKNN